MSDLLADLRSIVGERGLIDDPAAMEPHVTDFRGRMSGLAEAVVLPASTAEVSRVVALANDRDLPVYPLGGNTGLCYGAVPLPGSGDRAKGLVLGLGRMLGVREMDRAANVLTVDAGVTLSAVHSLAEEADRQFPLTLGSEGTAQIGGLISTNAGGTGVLRYGPMRDLVDGLEVVLADGQVLSDLSALRKNNTGYDLKQLFIGAEGTLGLITAAALRLHPRVRSRAHAWVAVPNPAAAVDLYALIQDRLGPVVEAYEMLNAAEVGCVMDHIPRARQPFPAIPGWSVMIELGESNPNAAKGLEEALEGVLGEALERELVTDAIIAQNETQAKEIWHVRHSVTEAHKIEGVGIVHDTAVRLSHVPAFIAAADEMSRVRFPDARILVVSHLGDGNVHYILMFDRTTWPKGAEGEARALEVEGAVHDIAARFGGTISAEHGIGRKLTTELERLGDPVKLDMMRAIKGTLDPKGLMNPGALLR
jgi:FAD/FMN-containing dehydrogenase